MFDLLIKALKNRDDRTVAQEMGFMALRICILIVVISLCILLFYITMKGFKVVNFEFITQAPRDGMVKGGIFPAILGTFLLSVGALIVALPTGVLTAVWLTEYATNQKFVRVVRIGINSLAGVPSIVFGLFGFMFFVKFMQFGVSRSEERRVGKECRSRWS